MTRSIFYQPASADPANDPWQRATGEPPFDITGLENGTEYRFDDGQNVLLRRPQGSSVTAGEWDIDVTSEGATVLAMPAQPTEPEWDVSVGDGEALVRTYPGDLGDDDAGIYIATLESIDGQPLEPAVAAAIRGFVDGCKDDGIWDALHVVNIMAGARTLAGALFPLKGPVPVNTGFVAGDYSRTMGLAGNGSNKFLEFDFDYYAPGLANNAHIASFSAGGSGRGYGSISRGSAAVVENSWTTGSSVRVNSTNSPTSSETAPFGFIGGSQDASGVRRFLLKSMPSVEVFTGANNVAPTGRPKKVRVFDFFDPSASIPGSHVIPFYSAGAFLDLVALRARVTTLLSDIEGALA